MHFLALHKFVHLFYGRTLTFFVALFLKTGLLWKTLYIMSFINNVSLNYYWLNCGQNKLSRLFVQNPHIDSHGYNCLMHLFVTYTNQKCSLRMQITQKIILYCICTWFLLMRNIATMSQCTVQAQFGWWSGEIERGKTRLQHFYPVLQNPGPRHLVYCSCEIKQELMCPLRYRKS